MESTYLASTPIIDCRHDTIRRYADEVTGGGGTPVEKAVKLFRAVRDDIWYDPYVPFHLPEHYRASAVLALGRGYCVGKASLLCALGRACRIPTRLGFATVKNHLATRQLIAFLGSDLFVYHGYVEFYLEERWVQATPAFNSELCRRHRVAPLEFNGRDHANFQPYNAEKRKFMEYVTYHGTFADIPVERIVDAWRDTYGAARVNAWIEAHEKAGGGSWRDFYREDPLA